MRKRMAKKCMAMLCAVAMMVGCISVGANAEMVALNIDKQPTDADPTVVVNKSENVTYQWYKAEYQKVYGIGNHAGKLVDGKIIVVGLAENYMMGNSWYSNEGKISFKMALEADREIMIIVFDDNARVYVDGVMLESGGDDTYWYKAPSDREISVLINSSFGLLSAEVNYFGDDGIYPVVGDMGQVIDNKMSAYNYAGCYNDDESEWESSLGRISLEFCMEENQRLNIKMSNVNNGKVTIYGDETHVTGTIPENGVYKYDANKSSSITLEIENDEIFTAEIYIENIHRDQAIDGETFSNLTTFEDGCIYSCLVKRDEEEVWSDYIKGRLMIKNQPTTINPTVELNYDEDVSYQWYAVSKDIYTVVDKNQLSQKEMNVEYIYYGEYSDGVWCSENYGDEWLIDAKIKANPGDKVIITLPAEFKGDVINWSNAQTFKYFNGSYECVIPEGNEECYVGVTSDTEFLATIKLEKRSIGQALEGENSKTLNNKEANKVYVCKVTSKRGAILVSDYVEIYAYIVTQPTEELPKVEVNFEKEVENYQWYEWKCNQGKVVDEDTLTDKNIENVIGAVVDNGVCEDGIWKPDITDMGTMILGKFEISFDVEAGQMVKIKSSIDEYLIAMIYKDYQALDMNCEDGYCYIQCDNDTEISIYIMSTEDFTLEISVEKYEKGEKIDGQVSSELKNHKTGEYVCEVTLKDGRKILSSPVSMVEDNFVHTYTDEYDADCNDCGALRNVPERPTEEKEESTTDTLDTISPNTSDGTNMMLLWTIACASVVGMLFSTRLNNKKYQ